MSKPPKHILLLGPAHPYRGGLAAFNERLAQALQAAGHTVSMVTFTLQYPDFLFPGTTQFSDDAAPADLHITRQIHALNPFNWIRTAWQLRRLRPDVVITAFWLPLLGPCLGTILRGLAAPHTRRIGLIHNIIPHEKRPGDRPFARYFAGACDGFITLSDAVEADMRQFTQVPARVSPHPIYDSYGDALPPPEARRLLGIPEGRYVLFFGFIRAYKGLDLLLTAMADPRITALGLRLIVAGEYYGNAQEYEALIDRLGIRDRLVLHTHFIANDTVRQYFSAADVVVQPYKTATQSGISQLAYHFERPMVVTNVGGLPEIVPDGVAGYVVEQSPRAIADALVDFYENDRQATLQAGVRAGKERYSWAGFVDTLSELF